MSRSHRQSPVIPWTNCDSEKREKQTYNRCLRHAVRQLLHECADFEELQLPQVRDVSDAFRFGKDGTVRLDPGDENFARLMRK
jgi:hypothetical protein